MELLTYRFSFSLAHYPIHYWLASFSFLFGALIALCSFLFYLKFLKENKRSYWYLSFVLFLSGLFVNEVVFTLPLLFIAYQLFLFAGKKALKSLAPLVIAELIFLYLRFGFFAPPLSGEYALRIGGHIFSNIKGYILWSFNWPEDLRTQFISFWRINPQFVHDFSVYYYFFTISLIAFVLVLLAGMILLMLNKDRRTNLTCILFYAVWYLLSLSPVFLFKGHSFSYHMPLATVGFCGLLALLLVKPLQKLNNKLLQTLVPAAFLTVWVLTTNTGIEYNSLIHWEPRRAAISKKLTDCISSLPANALYKDGVYIVLSSENYLALNGQDAVNVLLGSQVKTIYFHGVDLNCSGSNIQL